MVDTVKEVMITNVLTCDVDDSLQQAARIMRDKRIGCLIVMKSKSPKGILTERDITFRATAKNLDSANTKVKDVMSSPLKTISPDENVYSASKKMRAEDIKKLPVVKNGKLVGIITQTDLTNYFADQRKEFILENLRKSIKAAYPV